MDDDYMAMFNAGVDANIMLLKQKKIIVDQDAEIERLREALEHILKVNPSAENSGYIMRAVAVNALQQKDSE